MNEYPIHTTQKDLEPFRQLLVTWTGPLIFAGLLIVAFSSIPKPEKKTSHSLSKPSGAYARMESNPGSHMSVEEYGSFSMAVQSLLSSGWNVQTTSVDGTVLIQVQDIELSCAPLDPTPASTTDNEFPQYATVAEVASRLAVPQPTETVLIWDENVGSLMGMGGAERVDTDSLVWACPKLTLAD